MIALLRALVRLLAFVLLVALAVLGGAAAVFCIQSGRATLSLTHLSHLLQIPQLRSIVGEFLADLEMPGSVAIVAIASGAGAILLGLLLLAGVLVPRRERLVVLDSEGDGGQIAARRRALSRAATSLLAPVRTITKVRAGVRPRRARAGGRLKVRVRVPRSVDRGEAKSAVDEALRPLSESFKLSPRVKVRAGRERVQ